MLIAQVVFLLERGQKQTDRQTQLNAGGYVGVGNKKGSSVTSGHNSKLSLDSLVS